MKKVQRYFLDFDFLKYEKTLKFKNENSFKIIKNEKKIMRLISFFISK